MPNLFDVDSYLQAHFGVAGEVKRHKLCYAVNRLALVNTGRPLFSVEAEAWKWGPAFAELYHNPRRKGNPGAIDSEAAAIIDAVHGALGGKGGRELALRSHARYPEWREAREGLGASDNGQNLITFDAMRRALAREIATVVDGQVRLRVPSTKYADIQHTLAVLRKVIQGRVDYLTP
jgi:uncharacterized phage-associated protein